MHERQRKAHSSRRIRLEHGIAHLKNRRALARHSAAASTSATPSRPSPVYCPASRLWALAPATTEVSISSAEGLDVLPPTVYELVRAVPYLDAEPNVVPPAGRLVCVWHDSRPQPRPGRSD